MGGKSQVASHQPRVSIGMAIYNEEKFMRPALDSLLAQDYSDFELIISDNASTDATQAISREYAARDTRVRYHRNETNVGATENFNIAFRLSSGEYFMWAGGHDVWAPTYLSRCLAVLESDPTIVHCSSVAQHMSQDGKEIGATARQIDTRRYGLLVRANLILWQASTFLIYAIFRSNALRQTRLLRRVIGPDHLLGFELSLLGPTAIVPEPLYFMRDKRGDRSGPPHRSQYFAGLRERLYAGGKQDSLGRFWRMGDMIEHLRAVRCAPLSYLQRMAISGCVLPSYFLWFYPYVPKVIRGAVRGLVGRLFKPPHE
jgi:glycosyltransferase involved in cell wall biosynthesis